MFTFCYVFRCCSQGTTEDAEKARWDAEERRGQSVEIHETKPKSAGSIWEIGEKQSAKMFVIVENIHGNIGELLLHLAADHIEVITLGVPIEGTQGFV